MSRRALRAQADRRASDPTAATASEATASESSDRAASPQAGSAPDSGDAPVYLSRRARREAEALRAQNAMPEAAEAGTENHNLTTASVAAGAPEAGFRSRRERRAAERAATTASEIVSTADEAVADECATNAATTADAADAAGPRTADVTGPIRLAPARGMPLRAAGGMTAAERRRQRGTRIALTSIVSSIGLACSLVIAGPAQAAPADPATLADGTVQTLRVSGSAQGSTVQKVDYSASAMVTMVSASGDEFAHQSASAVAAALDTGGKRATIVRTALEYFGDPYVLGGASHSGIDCSGLTMVAYDAVGIHLAHYVPTQDARGRVISEADAQPGDFVVFNDEEHIGIYLGEGMVLHAPETGRTVSIEPVSIWKPMGIHFTTLLH